MLIFVNFLICCLGVFYYIWLDPDVLNGPPLMLSSIIFLASISAISLFILYKKNKKREKPIDFLWLIIFTVLIASLNQSVLLTVATYRLHPMGVFEFLRYLLWFSWVGFAGFFRMCFFTLFLWVPLLLIQKWGYFLLNIWTALLVIILIYLYYRCTKIKNKKYAAFYIFFSRLTSLYTLAVWAIFINHFLFIDGIT